MSAKQNNISPCLWFDKNAEEAVQFYQQVFKDSKILAVSRYAGANQERNGQVMTMSFELNGQNFLALNGGPMFKFTPAVSFTVKCATQAEIDYYWQALSADGGNTDRCGWLQDKFGLSWQIVPDILEQLLGNAETEKSAQIMAELLTMDKLDIARLQQAANS